MYNFLLGDKGNKKKAARISIELSTMLLAVHSGRFLLNDLYGRNAGDWITNGLMGIVHRD